MLAHNSFALRRNLQQTLTTSVKFALRLNDMVHMFFLLDVCEALVVSLNLYIRNSETLEHCKSALNVP
jgi:hypothetical protein